MGSSALETLGVTLNQICRRRGNLMASLLAGVCLVLASGCGSNLLKYQKDDKFKKIDDFDSKVKIDIPADPNDDAETGAATSTVGTEITSAAGSKNPTKSEPRPAPTPNPAEIEAAAKVKATDAKLHPATNSKSSKASPKAKTSKVAKGSKTKGGAVNAPVAPSRRQPELESEVGFDGRRPIKDPFRVGEKVVHQVHYFAVSAGQMTIEVKPFAQVNGKKSYHFGVGAKTSRWYSGIYSVDDKVSVLMDFETLVPSVYQLAVRETGQVKESRMLFQDGKAMFWERKVTDKHGEEENKKEWDILDYSQNVFSAAFYLRVFDWQVGQENAFRVADDGENLIFRGKAIRKEKISTDAGDFNAIVIQPQIELKGKFKPVGDIFIWLSDDDRKFILKIESKIKIGTLVSEVIELKP